MESEVLLLSLSSVLVGISILFVAPVLAILTRCSVSKMTKSHGLLAECSGFFVGVLLLFQAENLVKTAEARWMDPPYEEVQVTPTRIISYKEGKLRMEASFNGRSITLVLVNTFREEVRAGTPVQARRYYDDEDEFFVCR